MSLPTMTAEQRADALAKAAETRKARSEALARIRQGVLCFADAVDNPGPLQRAKVRQVLLAIPGVGPVKADNLMATAKVDPKRRVGGLGANQRKTLGELLAAA